MTTRWHSTNISYRPTISCINWISNKCPPTLIASFTFGRRTFVRIRIEIWSDQKLWHFPQTVCRSKEYQFLAFKFQLLYFAAKVQMLHCIFRFWIMMSNLKEREMESSSLFYCAFFGITCNMTCGMFEFRSFDEKMKCKRKWIRVTRLTHILFSVYSWFSLEAFACLLKAHRLGDSPSPCSPTRPAGRSVGVTCANAIRELHFCSPTWQTKRRILRVMSVQVRLKLCGFVGLGVRSASLNRY